MSLTMQDWIFTESYGRYGLDLGDSNVEIASISDLPRIDEVLQVPLGYGHQCGLPELRAAIAAIYPHVRAGNVLVCHGAQEAFSLLIRNHDDALRSEAIVVGSGWAQHSEFPRELGLSVVNVPLDDDEAVLLDNIAGAVTWRTRYVIVASPDNPTCWRASRQLIDNIAEIVDVYDALLIVDEEYVSDLAESVAGSADSVAVIGGLSKLHGLPGLRIGWAIASPELIERAGQRKHLTTIANSVLCESLAVEVVAKNAWFMERAKNLCQQGLATITDWAEDVPEVDIIGTGEQLPFAWLKLRDELNSLTIARLALERGVLVIPGEVFDRPGHLRVAIARPIAALTRGLATLAEAIAKASAGCDLVTTSTSY